MSAPQAVRALFGSAAEAEDRRVRPIQIGAFPGEREQEICTPQEVLDCVEILWPGGAVLDPCGSHSSLRTARFCYIHPADDGLELPWACSNFVNPPYGALEDWLIKATTEWLRGNQSVLLVPARTHRTWFRDHVFRHPVCWLDPLTFVGYAQSFPAPLLLAGFGVPFRDFERAFWRLGTCSILSR